jgi:DNA-binding transcriptional MerR regulator
MKAVSGKSSLSSGELAELTKVSRDTLRHYERKGVLPRPLRGHNGYRQYPSEALQRVQLVRRALSVGFTLDELARVLKVRDAGGAPCEEVRRLAAQKLLNVQHQLRELTKLRDDLQETLRDWDARLAHRAKGKRANLLESLSVDPNPAKSSHRSIKHKKEK